MLDYITRSQRALALLFSYENQNRFLEQAADMIAEAFTHDHKLLVCGNGGSAADAQHIVGELVGTFTNKNRPGLPAIALTTDTSVLTAIANDFSYNRIFSRQVKALGRKNDVLLAISTSGKSRNVLAAMEEANMQDMWVIGLSGSQGWEMNSYADLQIEVPAAETPIIQQLHQVAYHAICAKVEEKIFG